MKCIGGLLLLAVPGVAQSLLPAVDRSAPQLGAIAAETGYVPMSGAERWHQFLHHNLTGAGAYLRPLKSAAFQEMSGRTYEAWPATTSGLATRWASSFGRNLAQGGITDGIAAALGHDTRYHPCLCDGTSRRLRHALLMSVFTLDRNGNRVWDTARISGLYGGALTSLAWRPHNVNPGLESARLTGLGLGAAVFANVAREFTPELKRLLHRTQ
jgi:hypothetical protein